jgi:hypothetical protein
MSEESQGYGFLFVSIDIAFRQIGQYIGIHKTQVMKQLNREESSIGQQLQMNSKFSALTEKREKCRKIV